MLFFSRSLRSLISSSIDFFFSGVGLFFREKLGVRVRVLFLDGLRRRLEGLRLRRDGERRREGLLRLRGVGERLRSRRREGERRLREGLRRRSLDLERDLPMAT